MAKSLNVGFADRMKASAEAKQSLLKNFKPKPTVTDPLFEERAAMKAAEIERVRAARAAEKAAKKQAAQDAIERVRMTEAEMQAAALDVKRNERKERKAQVKAEARARRETRSQNRGSRVESENW